MTLWRYVLNTLAVLVVMPFVAVFAFVMFFWDLWKIKRS